MTISNDELAHLLPLAAKACGRPDQYLSTRGCPTTEQEFAEKGWAIWQPHVDTGQCAWMNAALGHNTSWLTRFRDTWPGLLQITDLVEVCHPYGVAVEVEHNGTTQDKLRAWMEASVRAAARIGEKK